MVKLWLFRFSIFYSTPAVRYLKVGYFPNWLAIDLYLLILGLCVGYNLHFLVQHAAPVLWIIIGIFVVTHGVIAHSDPPEMSSLEFIINRKQFSHNLPLKQILLCGTNLIYGLTGIITMARI